MCDEDIHNILKENDEQICPFCDSLLFVNNIKFSYNCCDSQLLEDIDGMNVCINCGIVLNSISKCVYFNFYEKIFKITRKSIYFRKYHIRKIIDNLIYKNLVQLSVIQITRILKIFNLFDKIINDLYSNRKRIININYILVKIFNMMDIEHKIIIKKSKQTLCLYNDYWAKILYSIGDQINSIIIK